MGLGVQTDQRRARRLSGARAGRARRLAAAIGVSVALAPTAPAAAAPTPLTPVDPLAILPARPAPPCGQVDDAAQAVLRAVATDRNAGAAADLGPYATLLAVLPRRPLVAVCDPVRNAAGAPGLGIGGTLADERPVTDAVSAGYRQLSANVFDQEESDDAKVRPLRGGGLVPGDTLTIPAASGGSTLTAAVLAGAGTQLVTFDGWGDGVSTAQLTITADAQSRTAVLQRADGLRLERRVELLTPPAPTFALTSRGRLATLTARGLPAGLTYAETNGGTRANAAHGEVNATGATVLRMRTTRRTRTLTFAWASIEQRRYAAYECALRRRSGGLRLAKCHRTVRADGGAFDARPESVATPARLAQRARRAALSVHRHEAPRAPRARAAAAADAPVISVALRRLGVPQASMPIGDLDGDGRAEFTNGNLWLSGTRRSTNTGELYPYRIVDDLNGDGRHELLLQGGTLVLSEGPWTASSLLPLAKEGALDRSPRTIELTVDPDDDSLAGGGPTDLGPLPDVTGDGRPELAVVIGDGALSLPSQPLVPGAKLTVPTLAFRGDAMPDQDGTDFDGGPADTELPTTPLAVGGGLYRLVTVEAARRGGAASSVVAIEQLDALGRARSRTPDLTIPGHVGLHDRDPISGDLLLLSEATACDSDTTDSRTCTARVTRVRADGSIRSSAQLTGNDFTEEPMFGPDGPDADALPDVFLPTYPTSLMPSAATGALAARELPVLYPAGRTEPISLQWRTDQHSAGQSYRTFAVQTPARGRLGMPWRGLVFAP